MIPSFNAPIWLSLRFAGHPDFDFAEVLAYLQALVRLRDRRGARLAQLRN